MTIAEMERHPSFRRAYWKRNLYLLLLLICEVLLLGFLASLRISTRAGRFHLLEFDISFVFWSWGTLIRLLVNVGVIVGFSHWGFIQAFKSKSMLELYPTDRSKGRTFGSLSGPELVAMVQEVAGTLGVRRIDRIAVTRQPDPNAYTARILGLGNVVVLHTNLLDVLPRQGVRSVIAHEVGHIRRRDSILYQFLSLPRTAAWVVVLLCFARMVGGVLDSETATEFFERLLFLAVAAGLVSRVFGLLERLANLASQQTELMVDAYAAQVCGWHNHLNALLLVGERAEVLGTFMQSLQKVAGRIGDELSEKSVIRLLHRLPLGEIHSAHGVESTAGLYVVERLTRLRDKLLVPLTDEEIAVLAARAAEALRQCRFRDEHPDVDEFAGVDTVRRTREEAEQLRQQEEEERLQQEKEMREKLLFWREYDRDRSGDLDLQQELGRLVDDLRKHPTRMIFREFLEPDGQWKDHPTTRHRILFLADLFGALQTDKVN